MAVLLGHGRRGGLDQGEGTAHVLPRPRTRPYLRQSAAQQAQGRNDKMEARSVPFLWICFELYLWLSATVR